MKRSLSLSAFLTMLGLSMLPAQAQLTRLPAQGEAVAVAADAVEVQDAVQLPPAQVVDASEFLNPLVAQEWVVADADDQVHGTYSVLGPDGQSRGLGGVTVSLGRNGVVIQSTVTEPDGHFVFQALGAGTYALVAKAPNSLAAYALHVLPNGASNRLDSNFAVVGTSVAGPVVGEILRAHLVPGQPVPGYYPDLRVDPYGDERRFNPNATVQLSGEGLLVGRISRPSGRAGADLSGNVVHILRGGRVVGHVTTNAAGEFQVAGLTAGIYDFVIAGKDGVAAGAFLAVAAPGVAQKDKAEAQLVSTVNNQNGVGDSLNVELISPTDWMAGEPEFVLPPEEEFAMAPVPGGGLVGPGGFGGGGGGFGGGGAGGGGLGGLGGLLGIAGLAAGIAALASEDEGFTVATPQ